jgi:CHAD domain-containing protein
MSFVITAHDTPGHGLERAMREQAEKLSVECEQTPENVAAFAHKARVRCKKIRAGLRLAEPLIGRKAYRRENRWWRDAARQLSGLRDVGAGIEAVETLTPLLTPQIGSAMIWRLKERFEKSLTPEAASELVGAFREVVQQRKKRDLIPDMPAGDVEDLTEALAETYRSARRAMRDALEDNEPELLHEWRKQTKYHSLQVRLMRTLYPGTLGDRVAVTRDLAEKLGEVHDIEVVLEGVKGWEEHPEGLAGILTARREALIAEARTIGAMVFDGKPKVWRKSVTVKEAAPETAEG